MQRLGGQARLARPSKHYHGKQNIWVTTTYSGALTVEHVLHRIRANLEQEKLSQGTFLDNTLKFDAATDCNVLCRKLAMECKSPPLHVFGQIQDRILHHSCEDRVSVPC